MNLAKHRFDRYAINGGDVQGLFAGHYAAQLDNHSRQYSVADDFLNQQAGQRIADVKQAVQRRNQQHCHQQQSAQRKGADAVKVFGQMEYRTNAAAVKPME